MMTTKNFLEHINQTLPTKGRLLIIEFFFAFSRFECALKATNFKNGNADRVQANWDSFVASINQHFNESRTKELETAVNYIIQHPPKIQALSATNQLTWIDRTFQPNEPLTKKLKLHICDIRNNLFHGGKFYGSYQEDVSRNYKLLKNSIIILNEWLKLNTAVQASFLQPIR